MNTAEPIQPGAEASTGGSWLTTLDRNEKRTLAASFSGYAVDAFDYYTLPLVTPILLAMWGMSKTEVGFIGTATLVASALGGWLAGILADRYGRVRILQLTILVFAVFTFACGLAQTPEQLLIARALQGLGFGGEWAVGSVLIAEMIRPALSRQGGGPGAEQLGRRLGRGGAGVDGAVLLAAAGDLVARDVLLGLLPAVLIVFIRRSIQRPGNLSCRPAPQSPAASAAATSSTIFTPGILRTTVLASLLFTGMQGGYYAIGVWLPTFLKNERHLTVLGTGGYQFMFIVGAFIGYLCGAYLSDRLGRRLAFILFAIGAGTLVYAYTLLPITDAHDADAGLPAGLLHVGHFQRRGRLPRRAVSQRAARIGAGLLLQLRARHRRHLPGPRGRAERSDAAVAGHLDRRVRGSGLRDGRRGCAVPARDAGPRPAPELTPFPPSFRPYAAARRGRPVPPRPLSPPS